MKLQQEMYSEVRKWKSSGQSRADFVKVKTYSFFACCKLNDINPQKWLQYVLENIANHKVNKLHELLPNNIDQEKLENFKRFWEV